MYFDFIEVYLILNSYKRKVYLNCHALSGKEGGVLWVHKICISSLEFFNENLHKLTEYPIV